MKTITTSKYVIVVTHYWYGEAPTKTLHNDRDAIYQQGSLYDTRADAQEAIDEEEEDTYYLAHNESGRPDYKIARVDTLPKYLRACL